MGLFLTTLILIGFIFPFFFEKSQIPIVNPAPTIQSSRP